MLTMAFLWYSSIEKARTATQVKRPIERPTRNPVINGKPPMSADSKLGPRRDEPCRLRNAPTRVNARTRPQRRVAPVAPWTAGMKNKRAEEAETSGMPKTRP